jgi:Zn-dependent protease
LALAGVAALILRNVLLSGLALEVLLYFFYINIGLFVFNMLPLPPLDGSRVLYAVAPEPIQRFMEQLESYGVIIVIVFISLFYSSISPLLVSWQRTVAELLLG